MNEFELIKNYFAKQTGKRNDVIESIGDDAALVTVPRDQMLAITTDTLVVNTHFLPSTSAYDIAYKSLAVNLSDLASMGAEAAWVTLALTLPTADETWIAQFCQGFFALANDHHVQLIGGDLTRGPLAITITAHGFVPTKKALLRSGAKPRDLIYVTGTLGDAGAALQFLQNKIALSENQQIYLLKRLHRPTPRLQIGLTIRDFAHAAIDISDGLAADLSHILQQSNVGATVYVDQLPLSQVLEQAVSQDVAIEFALTAGDDYELCFTVPPEKRLLVENELAKTACRFTCVGEITENKQFNLCYQDGKKYHATYLGYQHFE